MLSTYRESVCRRTCLQKNVSFGHSQVDVWEIDTAGNAIDVQRLFGYLSSDEVRRAERFHFHRDRMQYVVARGGLRDLLGNYLGKHPREIVFSYTEKGKPWLANTALRFNLSHSHKRVMIAITWGVDVGIDIEYTQRDMRDYLCLAERFFADEEYRSLIDLPKDQQQRKFFDLWTCKEAFVKALGEGLHFRLNDFVVSCVSGISRIDHVHGDEQEAASWKLFSLYEKNREYTGAVALQCQSAELGRYEYPHAHR